MYYSNFVTSTRPTPWSFKLWLLISTVYMVQVNLSDFRMHSHFSLSGSPLGTICHDARSLLNSLMLSLTSDKNASSSLGGSFRDMSW